MSALVVEELDAISAVDDVATVGLLQQGGAAGRFHLGEGIDRAAVIEILQEGGLEGLELESIDHLASQVVAVGINVPVGTGTSGGILEYHLVAGDGVFCAHHVPCATEVLGYLLAIQLQQLNAFGRREGIAAVEIHDHRSGAEGFDRARGIEDAVAVEILGEEVLVGTDLHVVDSHTGLVVAIKIGIPDPEPTGAIAPSHLIAVGCGGCSDGAPATEAGGAHLVAVELQRDALA